MGHTEGMALPRRHAAGRLPVILVAVLAAAVIAAGAATAAPAPVAGRAHSHGGHRAATAPTKVMVVAMENHVRRDVIGAPYISSLIPQSANLTRMHTGYPTRCPSLAAYLLITAGSRFGICDDGGPSVHPLDGTSVFTQVARAGRRWRVYAESMPERCSHANTRRYVVRHTAAPYFTRESARCQRWQVKLGSRSDGPLARAARAGRLPAYSLVVPNQCHNMHGAPGCRSGRVRRGDTWLSRRLPTILDGPDFTAGDLLVILTWDEGDSSSDHIATLLIHPSLAGRRVDRLTTHCGTSRLTADVLGLRPLRCAADVTAPVSIG